MKRKRYIFVLVLIVLLTVIFVKNQTKELTRIKKTTYSEEKIREIAKQTPEKIKLAFNSRGFFAIYGIDFIATYELNWDTEKWNFKDAIDLSNLDIALLGEETGSARFGSSGVFFSPQIQNDSLQDQTPVYFYDYAGKTLERLKGIAGKDWWKTETQQIEIAGGDSTPLMGEILNSRLKEEYSARLIGRIGPFESATGAWKSRISNMEFGFFVLDVDGNLFYGMSDNKGKEIMLFDVFHLLEEAETGE